MKKHLYLVIVSLILFCISCSKDKPQSRSDLSITDEALLDSVQHRTFKYFWDAAEPISGMARERYHMDGVYPQNDKNVVTAGGSGFGIMAIIAGIDRGYVSREAGLKRMEQIVAFLENADRYKGVFPHWWDGETGKAKAFSQKDDGGDIVETAFLIQGLLAAHQYYIDGSADEQALSKRIDKIWKEVDWNWYTNKQNVLYWHWSPEYEFGMNHQIMGFDECLIAYILAASSPTHGVSAEVYHKGWARDGKIVEEHEVEGQKFKLHYNNSYGIGPLFWSHYSFLGLNPHGLKDKYADYYQEMKNYTLANRAYCVRNPKEYKGYGENSWGLTASYSVKGYSAHSPGNDHGVISPTAALSSIVYTPEESMKVMRYIYHMGDKTWGPYGFYDAYSESEDWFPQTYLAIDQGPIAVMIENYRSQLLWKLFMSHPDVQKGLGKLGFEWKAPKKNAIEDSFYTVLPTEKQEFPYPLKEGSKPGFEWRGCKGWDWSAKQMLEELPYLKDAKINLLMNCYFSMFDFPEGDNKWWEPLPDTLKADYESIVQKCKEYEIEFCFALNPNLNSSRHIQYNNEKDFEDMWQHYKWMAELGVNWFCVALDDITEGIDGVGQSKLVNRLYAQLKEINPNAKMVFCPTIYASAWLTHKPQNIEYLKEVGKELHPDIYCFWTGDDVRGPISMEKAKEFKELIKHKIFIWDNYPVNNGVSLLNLGPVVHRDAALNTICDGYLSNAMRFENESNRIPLYTVADYAWNPSAYDPNRSIGQAILQLTQTEEQAELLKDLVDIYYGQLLGVNRHVNTARDTFTKLTQQKQNAVAVRLFMEQMEELLERFQKVYPENYMPEKDVIRKDLKWMKAQASVEYPRLLK